MLEFPCWTSRRYSYKDERGTILMSDRIIKRGKVWYAKTRYKGVLLRESLKTEDEEVAMDRLLEAMQLIREGVWQKNKTTFEKLAESYKPTIDVANKKRILRLHLLPVFKGKIVAEIDVESWVLEIAKTHPSSSGYKMFTVMSELGFEIPKKIKFRNKGKCFDETQVLEESQVLDVIENHVNPQYKTICMVSAYSGLRLGDVLDLRKKDVDFAQGITRKQNKTDKAIFIPMTPKLKKALSSINPAPLNAEGRWFPPYRSNRVATAVKRAFIRAGIAWGSFHHLRHFVACHLINHGVGIEMVQKILGHSNIKSTLVYARIKRDTIKQAMAVLGGK